jgi:hypothetical protein
MEIICKGADPWGPNDYSGLLCSWFSEPAADSQQNAWNYRKIELQLVAQRFLEGKLSRATTKQYSFDVIVLT